MDHAAHKGDMKMDDSAKMDNMKMTEPIMTVTQI
jgi:hypothetical protein